MKFQNTSRLNIAGEVIGMETKRLEIPLPNGDRIVVEGSGDMYPEFYIGVVNKDDVWIQDLAIVRAKFDIEQEVNNMVVDDKFEVLVYEDEYSEDYTRSFEINRYHGDEM